MIQGLYENMGISDKVLSFSDDILEELQDRFAEIDDKAEYHSLCVLKAMQENRVSEAHLHGSTGYGYNDDGRDTLEKVYASCFHAEAALVRSQIACGTHAIGIALSAVLRPGDEILSPVGKPYDTLENVIGINGAGNGMGSLAEFGITYRQVDLLKDSRFDFEGIHSAITDKTKLVTIQRSRGYDTRESLSVEKVAELIRFIRGIRHDLIIFVDNCYCEFVDSDWPTDAGADLCAGSLIKNPGGGLAPTGGYLVGKKEWIDKAAYRLTTPGLGAEVGASLSVLPSFYQGLYLAPTVVASSLKSAVFAAKIYDRLGFEVNPSPEASRHDIIQSIRLGSAEGVIAFCRGIQAASPVDAHVVPEPYPMPGYSCDVIMAAGTFIQGSSIELSADAPIREPYAVYFQGGLTWPHGKLGILRSVQNMADKGLIKGW